MKKIFFLILIILLSSGCIDNRNLENADSYENPNIYIDDNNEFSIVSPIGWEITEVKYAAVSFSKTDENGDYFLSIFSFYDSDFPNFSDLSEDQILEMTRKIVPTSENDSQISLTTINSQNFSVVKTNYSDTKKFVSYNTLANSSYYVINYIVTDSTPGDIVEEILTSVYSFRLN